MKRSLTIKESLIIAGQLTSRFDEVSKSYEYPLRDLIDHMIRNREDVTHEVVEGDGTPEIYYLSFRSPSSTWGMLCGVSGIYRVDAQSLKALSFDCRGMS